MRNRREECGQRRQHRRDFGIQVFGEKLRQKGERQKRKTEEENPDLASRFGRDIGRDKKVRAIRTGRKE